MFPVSLNNTINDLTRSKSAKFKYTGVSYVLTAHTKLMPLYINIWFEFVAIIHIISHCLLGMYLSSVMLYAFNVIGS